MSKLMSALMPLHASLEPKIKVGSLIELQKQIADWQARTFAVQTVEGQINHLIREAKELLDNPHDEIEMADCLILLLGISHKQGVPIERLIETAWLKFERAKKRQWPAAPDADGVYHHTQEAA